VSAVHRNGPINDAARVTDGIIGDFCEVAVGPHYIQLDLGKSYYLDTVMFSSGAFAASTPDSVTALQIALDEAKTVNGDGAAAQADVDGALRAALDNARASHGTFTCTVKSMLAKVAKLQKIPFAWTGSGALMFTNSNAAVCNVTPETGRLFR